MISKATIKRIRQLEKKKYRLAEGLFVAEGARLIGELRQVAAPVEEYFGEDAVRASFLQHPQGHLALFPLSLVNRLVPCSPLVLMLDGVQDPGNLGTILRVADWYGIDHIYCSAATVDVLSPKVVQASMGAIAHVKVDYADLAAVLAALPADMPVYATTLDGEEIHSVPLSPRGVIIMGNEGNGISAPLLPYATRRVTIAPFAAARQHVESLNVAVATAIVCEIFRRQ